MFKIFLICEIIVSGKVEISEVLKIFVQYLAIYNNENVCNCKKICFSRFKKIQRLNKPLKIANDFNN